MEEMWAELAKYYDIIYADKDYKKESQKLHEIIQRYKEGSGNELLDVASGTGSHIQYLKRHYRITGIDMSNDMLKIAKKKCPGIKFIQGNMVSFDLKKKFDIITCLFSSIGYVKTYNNLSKTIDAFSRHLKPGGIVVIEPFFTPQTWKTGTPFATFVDNQDVKIARLSVNQKRGNVAILDFHFLIATKRGIEHLKDKHELGLFDVGRFLKMLKEKGFQAKFLESKHVKGRGLYIGIKMN